MAKRWEIGCPLTEIDRIEQTRAGATEPVSAVEVVLAKVAVAEGSVQGVPVKIAAGEPGCIGSSRYLEMMAVLGIDSSRVTDSWYCRVGKQEMVADARAVMEEG